LLIFLLERSYLKWLPMCPNSQRELRMSNVYMSLSSVISTFINWFRVPLKLFRCSIIILVIPTSPTVSIGELCCMITDLRCFESLYMLSKVVTCLNKLRSMHFQIMASTLRFNAFHSFAFYSSACSRFELVELGLCKLNDLPSSTSSMSSCLFYVWWCNSLKWQCPPSWITYKYGRLAATLIPLLKKDGSV